MHIARQLLGETLLEVVTTDGVDVRTITHLGRRATIARHIAVLWTSTGCSVTGCHRLGRRPDRPAATASAGVRIDHRIDSAGVRIDHRIDHRIDWAATHHTIVDELQRSATTTTTSRPSTDGPPSPAPTAPCSWPPPTTAAIPAEPDRAPRPDRLEHTLGSIAPGDRRGISERRE